MIQALSRIVPKSRLLALLVLAVALGKVSPVSAALLGHWALDEGSGQTIGDSASTNTGTRGLNGSAGADDPTWTSSAKIGTNALSFDGNDWVNLDDVLDQGTNDFTVSLWLNADSGLGSGPARLIQKRGTGFVGDEAGWQLVVRNVSGTAVEINNTLWEDGTSGGGDAHFVSSSGGDDSPFVIGQEGSWIHLVSVFDNTNDQWIFYADGVEVKNMNVSSGIGSVDNDRFLTFGAADDVGPTQFFPGSLDDLGMFDRPLTPAEVTAIYTVGDNTDPLGNGADLNLNLSDAQALFDLHDAGSGSAVVGGLTWFFADDLTTDLGELTKSGGDYYLLLSNSGTGLTTIAPPVPEPSTLLLLGLGVVSMIRHTRRRRRRA